MEFAMKDLIIQAIDGSEPVEALQALIAVCYIVAAENGVGRFNLVELFSSTIDAMADVADAIAEAEESEDEESDAATDEQTDI
jgi:hypothetical protein